MWGWFRGSSSGTGKTAVVDAPPPPSVGGAAPQTPAEVVTPPPPPSDAVVPVEVPEGRILSPAELEAALYPSGGLGGATPHEEFVRIHADGETQIPEGLIDFICDRANRVYDPPTDMPPPLEAVATERGSGGHAPHAPPPPSIEVQPRNRLGGFVGTRGLPCPPGTAPAKGDLAAFWGVREDPEPDADSLAAIRLATSLRPSEFEVPSPSWVNVEARDAPKGDPNVRAILFPELTTFDAAALEDMGLPSGRPMKCVWVPTHLSGGARKASAPDGILFFGVPKYGAIAALGSYHKMPIGSLGSFLPRLKAVWAVDDTECPLNMGFIAATLARLGATFDVELILVETITTDERRLLDPATLAAEIKKADSTKIVATYINVEDVSDRKCLAQIARRLEADPSAYKFGDVVDENGNVRKE